MRTRYEVRHLQVKERWHRSLHQLTPGHLKPSPSGSIRDVFLWLEVPSMWAGCGDPNGLIHMPLCLDKERRNILEKGWRSEGLWTWAGCTKRQTPQQQCQLPPVFPLPLLLSLPFPPLPFPSSPPPPCLSPGPSSLLPVATGGREDRDLSSRLPSARSFQRPVCPAVGWTHEQA